MLRRVLCAILFGICVSAPAFGQGSPPDAVLDKAALKRESDTLFKAVYAKPNDLDSLFRYAEVNAQLGDYEAAIGALERILYFKPDLPRVRLELGVLYFRMKSYPMARSYFNAVLEGKDVPEPVRQKITAYLAAITIAELDDRPLRGYFQTGFRYQSNANAGPNGVLVRALGQDAILNSAFTSKPDWNWFAQGGVRWLAKIDDGRGDEWETAAFGYISAQKRFTALDLGFVEVASGPRLQLGWQNAWFRPYGLVTTSTLGGNAYMSGAGAGATLSVAITPWLILEPNLELRWRDYSNSPDYPFATEQDGRLAVATGLARGRFAEVWGWQALASWSKNDTSSTYSFYAFDQGLIGAGLSRDFALSIAGKEQIWTAWLHGSFSRTAYDAPNPIVDPDVTRVDREWRVALTLEAPITNFAGLSGSVSYSKTNSTLPNYDTDNFSVSFGPFIRF